jgi:hypothetical protein
MIAVILVPLCIAGLMACIWVMLWVQKKYSDAILDEQRAGYAHLRSLIAELEERAGLSEPTDVDDDEGGIEYVEIDPRIQKRVREVLTVNGIQQNWIGE